MEQTKTVRQVNFVYKGRDEKGRFLPGNNSNPKGNNQFTTIVPLIEALKKRGKVKGQDFWDMVAEKASRSDAILIAILKKLLPDKIQGEGGLGETKIIIVRANNEKPNENKKDMPSLRERV